MVISDGVGKVSTSQVSDIEVGYLVGTNDLIQNQMNCKANQWITSTKTEIENTLLLKSNEATTYSKT